MIDQNAAEQKGRSALHRWGVPGGTAATAHPVRGGWRIVPAPASAGHGTSVGGSEAAVRAVDGAVLRVPAGLPDTVVEEMLADS